MRLSKQWKLSMIQDSRYACWGRLCIVSIVLTANGAWQVFVLADNSLDEALNESISGDLSTVAVGICMMFLYSYSVLSRGMNVIHSRLAVSFIAGLGVVLGAAAGFGVVSACGVNASDLNQVLLYGESPLGGLSSRAPLSRANSCCVAFSQ